MTVELGMNLAGVERVFELEERLATMTRKVASLEHRARELVEEVERLEAIRRELRAEIVPYERGGELIPAPTPSRSDSRFKAARRNSAHPAPTRRVRRVGPYG